MGGRRYEDHSNGDNHIVHPKAYLFHVEVFAVGFVVLSFLAHTIRILPCLHFSLRGYVCSY